MSKEPKHCDDYIHDPTAPKCLRFFLLVNRMPAVDSFLLREFGVDPKLYAEYKGKRVRVVMASRLGDLGINHHFKEYGYEYRVPVSELTNFSQEP